MSPTSEQQGRKAGEWFGGFLEGLGRKWKEVALVLLTAGFGWRELGNQGPKESPTLFDKEELTVIVQEAVKKSMRKTEFRVGKMEAGWKSFVETLPPSDRLRIFERMAQFEEIDRKREEREN